MTQTLLIDSSLRYMSRTSAAVTTVRSDGGFSGAVAPLITRQRDEKKKGRVVLVGSGPGDPDLLTVKAVKAIAAAEAVVYDNLVGKAILTLIPPGARRIYAGKQAGRHALPQENINQLLIDLACEGLQVVRLKGGDPFIFGRGGEEMEALHRFGIAVEIVPGITAAAGAGACTGIPLTHRSHARMLVFATGHLQQDTLDLDWDALARPNQTVVIYMGLGALEIICTEMIAHGMSAQTPAAVVHAATTPEQSVLIGTLGNLPQRVRDAGMRSPALIMMGEVVSLGNEFMAMQAMSAESLSR